MTWKTLRGRLMAAVLAVVWIGAGQAAAGVKPADVYVLLAIHYLDNGRPFGSTDYGLRVGGPFCETQRGVLMDRWRREGAEPRPADALYLPSQGYTVRLYCIPEIDFENQETRKALLRKTLSAE